MQDNALIYIAKKVKKWFKERGINVTDWPPYLPGLNPIKHAWKRLKDIVSQMFPDIWNSNRKSEEDYIAIEEALKEAWAMILVSVFKELVESIEKRV